MTEFCEPCPLKGNCEGPIDQVVVEDIVLKDAESYISRAKKQVDIPAVLARYAVAVDANNGLSDPIPYHPGYDAVAIQKALVHRIDRCEQPRPRLLPWLKPLHCGAFAEDFLVYESTVTSDLLSKEGFLSRVAIRLDPPEQD